MYKLIIGKKESKEKRVFKRLQSVADCHSRVELFFSSTGNNPEDYWMHIKQKGFDGWSTTEHKAITQEVVSEGA